MNNTLREIFDSHSGRLIHKQNHYIEIYETYFAKYVNTDVVLLEIGIAHGGSLQMWKKYFGDKARIFAIDINPECKSLEGENVKIFIGSQEDKKFLINILKEIPRPDIIIDDGGHTMKQQITTFEMLYDHVKDNGIYLCEDTCTSYWYEYGGGLRRKGTFVEFSKNLIDYLYSWHFKHKKYRVNEFTKSTNAIHFYDSMIFFEKKKRQPPVDIQIGKKAINHNEDPMAGKRTIAHKIMKKIRSLTS
jgi:cephalosporin hydroxylase